MSGGRDIGTKTTTDKGNEEAGKGCRSVSSIRNSTSKGLKLQKAENAGGSTCFSEAQTERGVWDGEERRGPPKQILASLHGVSLFT